MKSDSLVTVLMVVRNGLPYIKETVDSILNQTYKNFNFLIIDNGSTDNTFHYLKEIKDTRVDIETYDKIGIPYVLNYGLQLINTKYIAIMDADDFSYSDRLRLQLDFLEKNPDVGLVGSSINYCTANSPKKWRNILPQSDDEIRKGLLTYEYAISHPTVMVRNNLIKKVGGYRDTFKYVPDLDFFLRLSKITKLANLPDVLLDCRISSNSFTHRNLADVLHEQRIAVNSALDKKTYLLLDSIIIKLNIQSQIYFRKAIKYYLNGSDILHLFFLLLSSIFNPNKAIKKLKRKIIQ